MFFALAVLDVPRGGNGHRKRTGGGGAGGDAAITGAPRLLGKRSTRFEGAQLEGMPICAQPDSEQAPNCCLVHGFELTAMRSLKSPSAC